MSVEDNLLLDFSELRWLVISCPGCNTEVQIDAGETIPGIPSQCPSCNKAYDSALRQGLADFRTLYKAAQFKIRVARGK